MKPYVVFVYADWCGHCQRTKPIVWELGQRLGNAVPVAWVDAEAQKDLADAFGVKSFPYIAYVTSAGPVPFQGERTLEGLTDFVLAQSSKF